MRLRDGLSQFGPTVSLAELMVCSHAIQTAVALLRLSLSLCLQTEQRTPLSPAFTYTTQWNDGVSMQRFSLVHVVRVRGARCRADRHYRPLLAKDDHKKSKKVVPKSDTRFVVLWNEQISLYHCTSYQRVNCYC